MNVISIAWITPASLVPLLFLPSLPGPLFLLFTAVIAVVFLQSSYRLLWIIAWSGLIFCWGATVARQQLQQIEELTLLPVNALVRVTATENSRQRIRVSIVKTGQKIRFPVLSAWIPAGDSVANFCVGQRWEMRLRLRAVHSQLNEGGYDQQRQALATYTPLQGKILWKVPLTTECNLRQQIIQQVQNEIGLMESRGILQALLFGLRDGVSPWVSQLFRDTGVAHLMAISGMHIGLAGGVGWWLAVRIQCCLPARYIRRGGPQAVSWLIAAMYTWVSGMQPPALRAMLAVTLWMIFSHRRFNMNSWQVWICCAALLVLADPMLILSDSFWLSMLAVLMLLVWYRWFNLPRRFRSLRRWFVLRLLHLQLGMMVLMLPLQALLFSGISLFALPANLLAIPVVSLLTLPLAGTALVLTPTGYSALLWQLADQSVILLCSALETLPAGWLVINDVWLWGGLAWGSLFFVRAGVYVGFKMSGMALLLSCLLWRFQSSSEIWRIDMLDVGHGLAVVISQQNEVVIYDTGNRWQHTDAGQRLIIPWLLQRQLVPKEVIISHRHLDHYGGLSSIKKRWPNVLLRTALDRPQHLPCFRGENWQWKNLKFNVLWPPVGQSKGQNDDSCIIKVSDGRFSLLLTGDIEGGAEKELVRLEKEQLRSTFIQVPHHGSNTSSVPVLLRRVNGQLALASLARYNSWKMPSSAVVGRYHDAGYRWLDTAVSGQISLRIYKDSYQVLEMREQIFPRWYHQWFGVKAESR